MDKIKCLKCKEDAIIVADNKTKPYCQNHFLDYFEKKVFHTIREYRMIKKDEHIAVALSGGKDSTTLLYILKKLQEQFPFKLSAIFLDEGIKGYRDKAYEQAKKTAKKLKVPLYRFSFDKEYGTTIDKIVKKKNRFGSCSYCGVFRRDLLNKAAKKIKASKLAVGHNLDDAVQTIILNLIRNEPHRLMRFGPNIKNVNNEFITRIQPLIKIAEIEVATYALINDLNMHFHDCPYAQQAMRQLVREIVNQIEDKYPGTKIRIFRFLETLQMEYKRKNEPKAIGRCAKCDQVSSSKICSKCKLLEQLQ
ncbi:MAG: TIGR00269 family protein [Candidatus Anstonellaceae archaeon]